jgi:hypothetical protein
MKSLSAATVLLCAAVVAAFAASSQYTFVFNNPASCPFGSALPDGCAGAQASGIIVDAHLADVGSVNDLNINGGSGYTAGTYTWTSSGGGCTTAASGTVTVSGGFLGGATRGQPAYFTIANHGAGCTSNPTIAVPAGAGAGTGGSITPTTYTYTPHNAASISANGIPNFNVPGVDYPVGYSRALTLKNPTTAGNLPSCASFSGHTVTITASNCTLNGFDFSSPYTNLKINGGLSGIVVSNNKFVCTPGTTSDLQMISIGAGSNMGVTIQYNDFIGNATLTAACVSGGQIAAINLAGGSSTGTITIQYNYCLFNDSKCYNFEGGGSASNPLNIFDQYNFDADMGIGGKGAHGEHLYTYAGNGAIVANETQRFNVEIIHYYWGSPNNSTAPMAMEADGYTLNNPSATYIMAMDRGTEAYKGTSGNTVESNSAPIYCGHQEGGTVTGASVLLNNFIDASASYYPYNTSSGTCAGDYPNLHNYNLGTGAVCTGNTASTC